MGRVLARIGLALGALVVLFALAELGLRAIGAGQIMTYARHPAYGYLMRPNQLVSTYGDPIEINALGLRGPPLLASRLPGVVRVLFLGDSITYGGGRVHEGQLFCRRIETMAREDGLRAEVVNVSAPGWSPQNWTAWVELYGTLGADLVVMVLPETDRARPFATVERARVIEHAPALRLATLWLRLAAPLRSVPPKPADPLGDNVAALRRLSLKLAATPLVVVFLPGRDPDPTPEQWAVFEALFPKALDLRGSLRPEHFFDDVHLSAPGHRAVADALYPVLRPRIAELSVGAEPRVQ
jgi:lysophospholipase L1-like esterase